MRFGAAPLAKLGAAGPEVLLGAAVYRSARRRARPTPCPPRSTARGHLASARRAPDLTQKLARGTSLIYVQKVLK